MAKTRVAHDGALGEKIDKQVAWEKIRGGIDKERDNQMGTKSKREKEEIRGKTNAGQVSDA